MLADRLDLGGAETHIVTLANRLVKMGHAVTVVSGNGRLSGALVGAKHVSLPLFKKSAFLYSFFALWRLFRKEKFDVIHAHTRFTAFLCAGLARKRLVCTAHWVFNADFPKKQLTVWGKKTLAVSPDIADYLKETYGCKHEDITVTVNGIDTERFVPAKRMTDCRRIVTCTRIDADRADAAFLLLDVMERLSPMNVSLTIVGDGDRFDELKQEHEKRKSSNRISNVHLTGGIADVAPYLADADIFVGVSRAALEGMAAGCAVILAGNEGYLSVFSPKSAKAAEESNFCCREAQALTKDVLTRDLLHLLQMPRRALLEMGEENRRYVERNYGANRMANDALSVYEKICKRECVLCGYYGFRNVGDELLLRALRSHLKKEGYGRIRLISAKRLSLRAFVSLLRGYDLILGGGNLLQDATSRRSLRFYLFIASLARRFELWGGIGPLTPEGERICKKALPRAVCIRARTKKDFLYAEHLGAKNALLSVDHALTLPFPKKTAGENILLAFRKPQKCDELAIIAFTMHLCRSFGRKRIFLFSMHPEDKPFTEQISALCGIRHEYGDADDFLSSLRSCCAVFSSRLHAGICAFAMEIPFFLWKGEEKCRFFIEDLKSSFPNGRFCDLFSFSDRISELPTDDGIKKALRQMRERI